MIAAGPRPPHTSQHRRSDMSNRVEDERILAAITIMRENLETPVSISDVAARIGLSKRFLQKLWKKSSEAVRIATMQENASTGRVRFLSSVTCRSKRSPAHAATAQARCFLAPSAISLVLRHDVTESGTVTRSLRQFVYLAEFFGSGG